MEIILIIHMYILQNNYAKEKTMNQGKKKLITIFVTMAVMGIILFVLSQVQGPKKATGVDSLSFAQNIGETANVCYVDGFRREDFYQILEIPTTVTLVKLGEENKNDYQVIGVAKEAFKDDTTLEEVVIPTSVTIIGKDAFSGCTNLKKITYKGTKSDWEKVTIEEGNESLTKVDVEFK